MFHRAHVVCFLATVVALGGCATSPALDTGSQPAATHTIVPAGDRSTTTTANSASGGYQMSADELSLDCKKLAGRMQIRILEIRDFNQRQVGSMAARAVQTGATTVFGGTSAGLDPHGAYARDRAMLEAYNRQLIALGCQSYDLDAELKPKPSSETPRAIVKPPAGTKPAAKSAR